VRLKGPKIDIKDTRKHDSMSSTSGVYPRHDDLYAKVAVANLLDDFHQRASDSDFKGYFDCFAPEGRFLGTDATENWTVQEFKKYAAPAFRAGKGWKYTPIKESRVLNLLADASLVCFDEQLESQEFGAARGTGICRRVSDDSSEEKWWIVQYHLSFPVPNSIAVKITDLMKHLMAKEQKHSK